MPNRRLPRANAFAVRGVSLRDPSRSWSGVSGQDGSVVLAMRTLDVRVDDHGCSCLLWARAMEWFDAPSKQGLDYGETAGVDPEESVSLRVVRICGEYWAKWGRATRPCAAEPASFAMAHMPQAHLAALVN